MELPERTATLGLGTASLAGLYAPVSAKMAHATVDAAWELGIRYFDTAPFYGAGLAEQRLGKALAGRTRDEYTISTKVGRVPRPDEPMEFVGRTALEPLFDFSPAGIRRSLSESLERLQLDSVDIAYLHDPDDHIDEALRAIDTVREHVPRVGVGTNVVSTALAFVERREIDIVLIANHYTLLDRSAGDELLPLCAANGVNVIAGGIFNSGVLAGGQAFNYVAAPPEILARRHALEEVCARYDVPLIAAAVQFPLRHPAVVSILFGASSSEEIEEDVRLADVPIPDELWSELDALGATAAP